MPRILHQGRPAAAAAARPPPPKLPAYEPPMHPLDATARASLRAANDPRVLRTCNLHIEKSIDLLTKSVASVNDRVTERRKVVDSMEKRRLASAAAADGVPEKTEEHLQQEACLAELEVKVARLTEASEAAMREVLDYRVELADEEDVFTAVEREVARQQPRPTIQRPGRRRRGNARVGDTAEDEIKFGEDDEDMPDADDSAAAANAELYANTFELLKQKRAAKESQYKQLSMHQRYGQDNDYISFRKTWHDAVHDGDGVPVPHASTWFDAAGRPVAPTKNHVQQEGSDDELVIQREVVDLRCPLSQALMTEPYTSRICKHTFEKSAIFDYISQLHNSAKCPVCTKPIKKQDLLLDVVMLRRIKRAAQEEQEKEEEENSDAEEEQDTQASLVVGRSNLVKTEKRSMAAPG